MTDVRYEKIYCEARDALFRRGKRLGRPRAASGDKRLCAVDGALLTDRELFVEAWGPELADEIVGQPLNSCCAGELCPECQRLWEEYSVIAACYYKLLKAVLLTDWRDACSVEESARQRRRARSLLLEHAADHHLQPLQ